MMSFSSVSGGTGDQEWVKAIAGDADEWDSAALGSSTCRDQRRKHLEKTATVRTTSDLVMDKAPSQEPRGVCFPM